MKKIKGKNIFNIIGKILWIMIMAILLIVLFINAVIIVKSYMYKDKVPDFMGWKPFITISNSMHPIIDEGDLVITKEVDTNTLKVGDIIAFRQGEVVIARRIIEINETEEGIKIITKGDADSQANERIVFPNEVEGIFVHRIKRLGELAMFIQTSKGMVCMAIVLVVILIIVGILRPNEKKENLEEEKKNLEQEIKDLRTRECAKIKGEKQSGKK